MITVNELWGVIVAICAGLGSIIGVYKFFSEKISKKTLEHDNELRQEFRESNEEIKEELQEIKRQNEEFKTQMAKTIKLTLTMCEELQSKGHLNGDTTAALHELQNHFISNK